MPQLSMAPSRPMVDIAAFNWLAAKVRILENSLNDTGANTSVLDDHISENRVDTLSRSSGPMRDTQIAQEYFIGDLDGLVEASIQTDLADAPTLPCLYIHEPDDLIAAACVPALTRLQ